MLITTWTPPDADSRTGEEQLVGFDQGRPSRILVLPAWFDEANKLRRFTIEVMRKLDEIGIDSALPDLPGCNESRADLRSQTIAGWREAAKAAAQHFRANYVLSIRAAALITPEGLPGWRYAEHTGPKLLNGMLRARVISAREQGLQEDRDSLLTAGKSEGLTLAGWSLGAEMIRELETAVPPASGIQYAITQTQLGGAGLWLRAEPDDDAEQSTALAALIAEDLATPETPAP
ncbi:MAG: hypothetical protein SXU28_12230 [Pseudomonadota bacterium]|nr:hypothetical protein [Pseudomonadota bacterium]